MRRILSGMVCVLFLYSCSNETKNPPTDTAKFYTWQEFSMGVDLSYVNRIQDNGGQYRENNAQKDPFELLKAQGANTVRVRLWHNPQWVANLSGGKFYHDLADVEKAIQRAKTLGMAVNLDFHYSDTWADPANQTTPVAWSGLSLDLLKDSLYNYTLAVLNHLKGKNLTPEMVQVGNETNSGLCWPVGKVTGNDFSNFSELLKSGIQAVRDFSQSSTVKPKIILHQAQIHTANYWLQNIIAKGVTDYDYIGLSHYCKWATVNTMQGVTDSLKAFKTRYGKPVMIVETAFPWTGGGSDSYGNIFSASDTAPGYSPSKEEQYRYLKDLTLAVMKGNGVGVQYWEPAWISSSMNDGYGTGSSWENCAFFDFNGNIHTGASFMKFNYQP